MRLRSALRAPAMAEAAALLAATRVVLWVSPRSGTARLLERASKGSGRMDERTKEKAAQVSWAVDGVGRWMVGSTCLNRALTGWLMLRRRGVPAAVRVGARAEATGPMRMHAWLEVGADVVIGRDEAAGFVPLSHG